MPRLMHVFVDPERCCVLCITASSAWLRTGSALLLLCAAVIFTAVAVCCSSSLVNKRGCWQVLMLQDGSSMCRPGAYVALPGQHHIHGIPG